MQKWDYYSRWGTYNSNENGNYSGTRAFIPVMDHLGINLVMTLTVKLGDRSGCSVSFSADGTIVAIGPDQNNENGENSGHVRLYQWDGSSWNQLGNDIDGEASGDRSGNSVALSSDGSFR